MRVRDIEERKCEKESTSVRKKNRKRYKQQMIRDGGIEKLLSMTPNHNHT